MSRTSSRIEKGERPHGYETERAAFEQWLPFLDIEDHTPHQHHGHPCAILSMAFLAKARELASVRESGDLPRMHRAEVQASQLLEGLRKMF